MAINGHWRLGRAEAEATAGAMFALGIEWLMGDRCRRRRIPAAAKRNRVQRLIIPSKDMQKRSSRTHQSLLLHSFFAKILQKSLLLEFFSDPTIPTQLSLHPSCSCYLHRTTQRTANKENNETGRRQSSYSQKSSSTLLHNYYNSQ